ncbi:hypothetical protein ACOYR1_06360 [Thalassotalea piscium]
MTFTTHLQKATLVLLFTLLQSHASQAHMIVAQHGTLNKVEGGIFMVLSLPISAFEGIDDNQDGKLSNSEFSVHRNVIVDTVKANVTLHNNTKKLPLQGMLISPVIAHDSSEKIADQIVIMGRFPLDKMTKNLHYQIALFGKTPAEQQFEITATDKANNKKYAMRLTPNQASASLFTE